MQMVAVVDVSNDSSKKHQGSARHLMKRELLMPTLRMAMELAVAVAMNELH